VWKKDNVGKFFIVTNNPLFMKKAQKCPICEIPEKYDCDCECHDNEKVEQQR
jgi:hypothetical protein